MNVKEKLRQNHLFRTFIDAKGNARACLYTEPLWTVPHSMVVPFATLYMYALGLSYQQIGFLVTLNLVLQVFYAFVAGILTDKFGRHKVTFIGDLMTWSVPCFIWMFAQDFRWFLAAVIFNAGFQITAVSWTCLLVEDTEKSDIVNIFTGIHLTGLLSVFFAPLSVYFVGQHGLVTTVRILYFINFISMTAKFIVLYKLSHETKVGKVRMQETRDVHWKTLLVGYGSVFKKMIKSGEMRIAIFLSVALGVVKISLDTFYPLYIVNDLYIDERLIAVFPIIRSAVMLLFMLGFQHIINRYNIRKVMSIGVLIYILSQILLIVVPPYNTFIIFIYTIIEAIAFAFVFPRKDGIVAAFMDEEERSRATSILQIMVLIPTAPFGLVLGEMSQIDIRLTFAMNMCLFIAILLVVNVSKAIKFHDQIQTQ